MWLGRFYFEKNQKNANPCAHGVQLQFFYPRWIRLAFVMYKMPELGSS